MPTIAAVPTMPRDDRHWSACDWPKVLVVALFLSVLVTIGGVRYYRKFVASLPEPSRYITPEQMREMMREEAAEAAMNPISPRDLPEQETPKCVPGPRQADEPASP